MGGAAIASSIVACSMRRALVISACCACIHDTAAFCGLQREFVCPTQQQRTRRTATAADRRQASHVCRAAPDENGSPPGRSSIYDSEPHPDSFFPDGANTSLDQKQAVMQEYLANAMREMQEYEAAKNGGEGSSEMETSELLRQIFGPTETQTRHDASNSEDWDSIDMTEIDARAARIRRAIQQQDPDLFGPSGAIDAEVSDRVTVDETKSGSAVVVEKQKQEQIENRLAEAIMDVELREFGYTSESQGTDASYMLAEMNRARSGITDSNTQFGNSDNTEVNEALDDELDMDEIERISAEIDAKVASVKSMLGQGNDDASSSDNSNSGTSTTADDATPDSLSADEFATLQQSLTVMADSVSVPELVLATSVDIPLGLPQAVMGIWQLFANHNSSVADTKDGDPANRLVLRWVGSAYGCVSRVSDVHAVVL